MRLIWPRALCLLAGFCVMLALPGPVRAQSCSISVSNISFGAVSPLTSSTVDATATLTANCTGTPLLPIRICPSIGAGSGGADGSARYMDGPGGSKLAFQLYTNAPRTTVWGSKYWAYGGTVPSVNLTLGGGVISGSGSASATIYGRVFSSQSTLQPGTYSSNFTTADNLFDYGYNVAGILSCDNISLLTQRTTPTFTASASADKNCLVSTTDINFGTTGLLNSNVDAQGTVTAKCTNQTSYSIALSNGMTGTGPTTRLMTASGGSVGYGIYKDAGHSQPWGNSGGDTQSGTGTGSSQVYPTYGRVPPQTTPAPDTYSDTVVVTLTY